MNRNSSTSIRLTCLALFLVGLFIQSLQARELQLSQPTITAPKPVTTVTIPNVSPSTTTTTNLVDTLTTPGHDVINPHCAELNAIAISLGERPPNACNDDYETNYVSPPPQDDEDDADPVNSGPEPVLLIHGFSATAAVHGHNCETDYWGAQKKAIKDKNKHREVKTIGWYSTNTDCDVDLQDHGDSEAYGPNTPIADVAEDLYNYIKTTYTMQQKSVDIVAHSLGGLIVRKMLDNWGDELWVSDVVTLATPHNGVKLGLLTLLCGAWVQCSQSLHDGPFMNALEHNPQSAIPTKWTLIGAAVDNTIGENTATNMKQKSSSRPSVSKYNYKTKHKHNCGWFKASIGHGDVHGDNGSKTVRICDGVIDTGKTVKKPTRRMMDALD